MMLMEDRKFDIELEVITPLSVGAGNDNDWMRGIDYIQKDGKVYVLDIKKAVEQGIDIDKLTMLFQNRDDKGISLLIGNKLEEVSRYVFPAPVNTQNPIKSFLRTQLYDKPVVAGSSIKGSVRSALFNYLRDDEKTNEEVFGNMKEGTDLMRFVRISDIEMPSTSLVNTKIFNLRKDGSEWFGGWKHGNSDRDGNSHTNESYTPLGFNTLYECVTPGQKGIGLISLKNNLFELLLSKTDKVVSKKDEKRKLLGGDITKLFHIVNRVTKGYLLKEKSFFERYTAERSEELLDNVNALLDMIPDDDSCCLLKMSAGVGFHSITGDWQYDDYSQTGFWSEGRNAGKKKYKSRKTTEYEGHLQLMGFVKLRVLSADEAARNIKSLNDEHAVILDSILMPARKREEDRQKKLEEEQIRKQAKEEADRKQQVCQRLLEQAQQAFNNSLWDDCISKAEKALAICPDNHDIISLIDKSKKAKEIEEYRKNEEAASAQKYSLPLSEVIKGKTSAGNLIGTTVKWLKSEGHVFGDTEYQALLHEVKLLPAKEQKNVKSKAKDLSMLIGEDIVKTFLEELQKQENA